MTPSAADCEVLVADHDVDALLLNRADQRPLLVLQPFMSFGAAVRAVATVWPNMPTDEVRALVRKHLPNAVDLDEMLPTPLPGSGEAPGRVFGWFTFTAVIACAVASLMLVAGFYLVHVDTREKLRQLDRITDGAKQHLPVPVPVPLGNVRGAVR